MRLILLLLFCLVSFTAFSQEESNDIEEFIPINIEDKEAFMSTKTGEFVFRAHDKTDPTALVTTKRGVIYTDKSIHTVKKGETLSSIAKKHDLSVSELKTQNKLSSTNLKIDQKLKINKRFVVKSSSPVLSYAGEERIIAKLNPGQSPTALNAPPNVIPSKEVSSLEVVSKKVLPKKDEVTSEEIKQEEVKSNYMVKSGETLYSIAKKYKKTVQELKDLNNLTLNNLSVGQKLKL